MSLERYRLGMPFWSFDGWTGGLFSADARPADRLRQYAGVFNAVEGNTTFYHVPRAETVRRWAADTPDGFRFCFKLPRTLTHEAALSGVADDVRRFLARMAPLGPRLGPFLVQLPPSFGPRDLPRLEGLLAAWPRELRCAVELRHPEFFDGGRWQERVDALLASRGCDRVILDTRPLREEGLPAETAAAVREVLAAARHRKPDLPVIEEAIGSRPVLRLIAHPDPRITEPWLVRWSGLVARWICEGRVPTVFVHSPSNRESPALARRFHALLRAQPDIRATVGSLPAFAGDRGESASGQLPLL